MGPFPRHRDSLSRSFSEVPEVRGYQVGSLGPISPNGGGEFSMGNGNPLISGKSREVGEIL